MCGSCRQLGKLRLLGARLKPQAVTHVLSTERLEHAVGCSENARSSIQVACKDSLFADHLKQSGCVKHAQDIDQSASSQLASESPGPQLCEICSSSPAFSRLGGTTEEPGTALFGG